MQAEYQDTMNEAYSDLKKVDAALKGDKEDGHRSALQLCFDWYEQQEREGSKGGYRATRSTSGNPPPVNYIKIAQIYTNLLDS